MMPISHPMDITQIFILIVVLGVIWVVVRTVLRLAFRVLATGCALIVMLGVILMLFQSTGLPH